MISFLVAGANAPGGARLFCRWQTDHAFGRRASPEIPKRLSLFLQVVNQSVNVRLLSSDFNDQSLAAEISGVQAGENWPIISKNMKRADAIYSEWAEVLGRCCSRLELIQST